MSGSRPVRRLWEAVRGRLRGGARLERRIDLEIEAHIDEETRRLTARGMDPRQARTRAERAFGDRNRLRLQALRVAGPHPARYGLGDLLADLVHATRCLGRAPGYALLVLATLALGIAANLMMFAVVDGVLLQPLDLPDSGRLVTVYSDLKRLPEGQQKQPLHGQVVERFPEVAPALEASSGFKAGYFNLRSSAGLEAGGAAVRLQGLLTTPALFEVAGVRPLLGATYGASETRTDVVVLAHATWQEMFGADPGIVGERISLNGEPYEVVGVMPPGFAFPSGRDVPSSFHFPERPELWVAFDPPERGPSDLGVVGRLRPGATVADLQGQLDAFARAREQETPQAAGWVDMRAEGLREHAVAPVRPMVLALFLATGLVLLVAAANVAGSLLTRTVRLERELAVRAALGAGRQRLVGLAVSEGIVVALAGSVLGTAAAALGLRLLAARAPASLPGVRELSLSPTAVAYAVAATLVTALLCGLLPGLRARQTQPAAILAHGGRSMAAGGRGRLGDAIVAVEIAVTVTLLVLALSLSWSLSRLLRVDLGFRSAGVLTAEITLPETAYPDAERTRNAQRGELPADGEPAVARFHERLLQRLRGEPGVEAAGVVKPLPMSGSQEGSVYWIEGMAESEAAPLTEYTIADGGYFAAMAIPVQRGRAFTPADTYDGEPVAMVSESLATLWPEGRDALGGRIKLGGRPQAPYPWRRVVGVVADVKRGSLTEPPRPEMYVPVGQAGYPSLATMQVVVRGRPEGDLPLGALRRAVAGVDSAVPVARPLAMDDLVAGVVAQARFAAVLVAFFALATVVLSMAGLYAVLGLSVQSRMAEFGIRQALGASSRHILLAVVGHGGRVVVPGLLVGGLLSLVLGRTVDALLYGVSTADPRVLVVAVAVLLPAAAAAMLVPARRAMRADPGVILVD